MNPGDELTRYVDSMQQMADEGSDFYTEDFVAGFRHGVEMVEAGIQDKVRNLLGLRGFIARSTDPEETSRDTE